MKRLIAFTLILMTALTFLPVSVSMTVSAVSPGDAIINIDFASGVPDGMELVGAELANDPDKGQVMSFAGGKSGTSFARLETDIIKNTDFSEGLSWTVWVKGQDGIHGCAPIFNIDLAGRGYLALLADLVVTVNSTGNEESWGHPQDVIWSDPADAGNEVSKLENVWTQFTVVINANGVNLYKNGKIYDKYPFENGNILDRVEELITQQMDRASGLTLGSYKCEWWNFGDFAGLISSAALYNKSLSADEIKDLFVNSGGIYEEDPTEAPAEPEPETDAPPAAEDIDAEDGDVAETPDGDAAKDSVTPEEPESGGLNIGIIVAVCCGIFVVIIAVVAVAKKKPEKK